MKRRISSNTDTPTVRICPVCQGQEMFVEDIPTYINGKMSVQHRGTLVDCQWCCKGEMNNAQYLVWKDKSRNGLLSLKPSQKPEDL